MSLHFTLWPGLTQTTGAYTEITWKSFVSFVSDPVVAAEKTALEGWSPAKFKDDSRAAGSHVESVSCVVMDDDSGALPLERVQAIWSGLAGIVHTTHSHSEATPKYRIVLRCARAMLPSEYERVWQHVCDYAASRGQKLDRSTKNASRFWYVPGHREGAPYAWRELVGAPLDVDAILTAVPAEPVSGDCQERRASSDCPDRRHAMAAALGTSWPAKGRHEAQLALAGALRAEGWEADDALEFLCAVCRAAGDEDRPKREATIRHTWGRGAGAPLTGWTRLKTHVDPVVVDAVRAGLARGAEWAERTERLLAEVEARLSKPENEADEEDGATFVFPVSALPGTLHRLATAQSEFTEVSIDLPALLTLGASSASVAGKRDLEIKPRYIEPLNLFILLGLPPSERKSPSFDTCFAPVHEAERRAVEAEKPIIAKKKAERDSLERLLRKRQSDYAGTKPEDTGLQPLNKARQTDGIVREIQDLAERLEQTDIATLPKFLVDDCTVERLATIMAEQRGRLCVASDEGTILSIVSGRYSNGKASFEVLLKGYSGMTPMRVDRQSKDRPPVFVQRPRLTVCLAVQPCIISSMSRDPSMRGQGLLARFLYSLPASKIGERTFDVDAIAPQVIRDYNDMIGRLQALPVPAEGEPIPTIKLTSDAFKVWQDFARRVEPRLHPLTGDLADIADWAGKLPGQVARIAGVFHMVQWAEKPTGGPIGDVSAETMANAVKLGEYFIAHARRAFQSMGQSAQAKDAELLLAWARTRGRFTARDLRRLGPRSIRADKPRLDAALRELVAQGRVTSDGEAWRVAR